MDYKHGHPRETEDGIELWPSDRVQLAVQGLALRNNGYRCEEGIVYYAQTRQRVRVPFAEGLIAETERTIAEAWALARSGRIPPPLVDSPKCPGCSLVGICLPDEPNSLRTAVGADLAFAQHGGGIQLALFPEVAPGFSPAGAGLKAGATTADAAFPIFQVADGAARRRRDSTGEACCARDTPTGDAT